MWIFWFRAQNPLSRYLHGILVSLPAWDIGFTNSKWWYWVFKISPTLWKHAAYYLDENKFLCRLLRKPISFPWLWRKSRGICITSWVSKLHQMDCLPMSLLQEPLLHGRGGDVPTHRHSSVVQGSRQTDPQPRVQLQQPQWYPFPCSLERALRIRGGPCYARGFCQVATQRSKGWTSDIS